MKCCHREDWEGNIEALNHLGKILPQYTLSIKNLAWTSLELNPGLDGEKPGTNSLRAEYMH
jgi:hypothetical protein